MLKKLKTYISEKFSHQEIDNRVSMQRENKLLNNQNKLAICLWKSTGRMVYSGPFASLPIPEKIVTAQNIPYILGSYERELHPIIYQLIGKQLNFGVIVGAGFGYYTIGLAYTIKNSQIIAFEQKQELNEIIKEWSSLSHTSEKIQLEGSANLSNLQNISGQPDFLLMDCEGLELDLLCPSDILWLSKCIIICEIHGFYSPNLLGELCHRLKDTHKIDIIDEYPVNSRDYQILSTLTSEESDFCIHIDRWIYKGNENFKVFTTGQFLIALPNNKENLL
jgi:hypothetical protein